MPSIIFDSGHVLWSALSRRRWKELWDGSGLTILTFLSIMDGKPGPANMEASTRIALRQTGSDPLWRPRDETSCTDACTVGPRSMKFEKPEKIQGVPDLENTEH
jgi:hypothetical protein